MRERQRTAEHAVREEGGEKIKDMLVHARGEVVDTLCIGRDISNFQCISDYILEEHMFHKTFF